MRSSAWRNACSRPARPTGPRTARLAADPLAPAGVPKSGTAFDLPIALGLLVATGQLDAESVRGVLALGELALDGTLRPVRGVLPVARCLAGTDPVTLVVPPQNVAEARLVGDATLAAPRSLRVLVEQLRARRLLPPHAAAPARTVEPDGPDLQDVVGQQVAKRALEIAAAGDHGAVLVGPPGSGKTLLARCVPGLLPKLDDGEALEVIAVHSVAGLLEPGRTPAPLRPFRAPHHSISTAGLVGGGSIPRPGEASLAHLGVLFLDELLEFARHTLEALRQPMEDGHVVLARAAGSIRYPARFTLIAAMNPCPCGHAGDATRPCTCAPADVARYRSRLSGPLSDRIDLHVHVSAVPVRQLAGRTAGESSTSVRERVERARAVQRRRYSGRLIRCNGHVPGRWLETTTPIASEARELLAGAAERLGLSARAYHRVLRVARTIADLSEDRTVAAPHVAEALRFRGEPSPGE